MVAAQVKSCPRFGTAGAPISTQSRKTIDGVKRVFKLGLSALEVEFVRGVHMSETTAREISQVAKDVSVVLSVHAPYYINLNGESMVVEKSIQRIENSCRIASVLGARIVVVHAAYYGKDDSETATKNVVNALKKVENFGVPVGLETMGRHAQWGSVDEIVSVCSSFDDGKVIPVVDWAHLHARSNGGLKTVADFENVYKKIHSWNPVCARNMHSHFAGVHFTERAGERHHLTIDSLSPDYSNLAKLIRKSKKFNPVLISESPNIEEDALRFKEMVMVG